MICSFKMSLDEMIFGIFFLNVQAPPQKEGQRTPALAIEIFKIKVHSLCQKI